MTASAKVAELPGPLFGRHRVDPCLAQGFLSPGDVFLALHDADLNDYKWRRQCFLVFGLHQQMAARYTRPFFLPELRPVMNLMEELLFRQAPSKKLQAAFRQCAISDQSSPCVLFARAYPRHATAQIEEMCAQLPDLPGRPSLTVPQFARTVQTLSFAQSALETSDPFFLHGAEEIAYAEMGELAQRARQAIAPCTSKVFHLLSQPKASGESRHGEARRMAQLAWLVHMAPGGEELAPSYVRLLYARGARGAPQLLNELARDPNLVDRLKEVQLSPSDVQCRILSCTHPEHVIGVSNEKNRRETSPFFAALHRAARGRGLTRLA